MAAYVIGDLQGCFNEFEALLSRISFDQENDALWLAGDLVNRGPDSLSCLRKAKALDAKIVLGNHDLHLLACYYSKHLLKPKDTLAEIFVADDCHELMEWLRSQPLMRVDKKRKVAMVHAGLPHIWSIKQARQYAAEVEKILSGDDLKALEDYFEHMYGNKPECWDDRLVGMERYRVITNYFTRMRFVSDKGALELGAKEGLDKTPEGFLPWFSFDRDDAWKIVFGHWAAIQGQTGRDQFCATDTGCVWGGHLTALNLDTFERISVSASHNE